MTGEEYDKAYNSDSDDYEYKAAGESDSEDEEREMQILKEKRLAEIKAAELIKNREANEREIAALKAKEGTFLSLSLSLFVCVCVYMYVYLSLFTLRPD